ncbi:hypothetical protein ENUP19_0181G0022 [Entamoeba nuttalli]|uniref:Dynamin gtpase n=2 Tax=Entamoeba nuttalli TaxID=412467 RepID=K2GT56_ENTNP|nr:dynamin gtpase [Entamoeba nuttalli P19]EKE38143.1 dynamin gtpase [Entamoeba nuttalli P19]|eukprot:XP_008859517.1 dynamin gtpase [Entamoeba nuttalli P19]
MSSTQVVRDILQVAKGMLPPSQQSTQNIRSIEEMARSLVAQKTHNIQREKTEEEKEKEREAEQFKKHVEEVLKQEKERMIKSTEVSNQRCAFFEKYEECINITKSNKKPEIIITGIQGSGKSELVEGIVGMPIEYINTSTATTVPIIIETVYKRGVECKCFFFVENEWKEVTVDEVPKLIEKRCYENRPIGFEEVLIKIESQNVIPLKIVDLPGFVEEQNETQTKVEKLWEKYVTEEEGKIILCVEKSTEERGENSCESWVIEKKNIRKNVVIVQSKFDNRITQVKDKEEMKAYLDGETEKCKYFYVSFLNKRGLTIKGFQESLQEKQIDDLRRLVTMGINEDYFKKVGVWRLNSFLKEEVIDEYMKGINEMSNSLKKQIEDTDQEIHSLEEEKESNDVDELKRGLNNSVSSLGNLIVQLITGECTISPKEYGETMEEERAQVKCEKWPGVGSEINIVGSGMKLYGGAQYERLLRETEAALLTMELPVPTADEVCVAMGIHAIGGMLNGGERVISVVIKTKASRALLPIISILVQRITHVFERLFNVALDVIEKVFGEKSSLQNGELSNALKEVYINFAKEKLRRCEKMLKDDLNSFVSVVDWSMLSSTTTVMEEENDDEKTQDEEELKPVDHNQKIKERVQKMMEERDKNEVKLFQELRNINGADSHSSICKICQRVFGVIRDSFWRNARSKLNAYFLQPMIGELKEELSRQIPTLGNILTVHKKSTEEVEDELNKLNKQKKQLCEDYERVMEVKNLLLSIQSKNPSQPPPNFESPMKKRVLF